MRTVSAPLLSVPSWGEAGGQGQSDGPQGRRRRRVGSCAPFPSASTSSDRLAEHTRGHARAAPPPLPPRVGRLRGPRKAMERGGTPGKRDTRDRSGCTRFRTSPRTHTLTHIQIGPLAHGTGLSGGSRIPRRRSSCRRREDRGRSGRGVWKGDRTNPAPMEVGRGRKAAGERAHFLWSRKATSKTKWGVDVSGTVNRSRAPREQIRVSSCD